MEPPTPPTPPAEDIDMSLFEDNALAVADPPARIAARFYRNSGSRRKTSANSSRRSSLSSIHSHSSARSSHGGPYSTHIAQHLRRASIIESRKARLADRAAHAEQVRLRAAAAKAAQKVAYSEEKALAAAAAREKLLAEIAARCEEEVRRAKKVAEETREKKAAELARLKEEMAEKFAEAARRKMMYQRGLRRPRTVSLAAVEEKKAAPVAVNRASRMFAAKIIQRTWRAYRSRKIVSNYLTTQLNAAYAKQLSFEELTKLISSQQTTTVTEAVLRHMGVLEEDHNASSVVRVFLSAYMISAHPMQALSHSGRESQEQDLLAKANALIELFEARIKALSSHPQEHQSTATKDALSFAFNDFTSNFEAWKSQDLDVLVDIMVNSFVNLDLILQTTKGDVEGRVNEDYLNAVRQEQIKLLARLKRLAGPEAALAKIKAAVRKARRQRAAEKEKATVEQVPRASTSTNQVLGEEGAPMTPPATPRTQRGSSTRIPSVVDSLGQIMTVLPPNREIAHEIMMHGTYEVQQRPWTEARKDLMDSLRNSMRDSMRDGNGEAAARWTYSMAVLIREKLMALVSPRHPLFDRIDGFLDPSLIDQQCRNGMFSYNEFFETISGLLAQICSPGRDETVAKFAANVKSDTIDRLFELINIIDLMTLDHINFQFRVASQSVLERGHEHEIASFEKDMQEGVHALEATKAWWTSAKANLAHSSNTGNAIYARGLTDLVLQNSHVPATTFPETLRLDYNRILKLRGRAFQMIATSSILLTTKIRLRRNRESLWANDAARLMSLDLMATDVARVVGLVESSHMMPDAIKEGLSNFVGRVLPPAVAALRNAQNAEQDRQDAIHNQVAYNPCKTAEGRLSKDDAFSEQIASYLLKSLREHVYARLSAGGTAERVRATTGAAEVLARAGMPEFLEEVNRLVEALERIRAVDLKCHGKWYESVADEVN